MRFQSVRVRLIAAYAGLIVLGFGGLALLAGQQLSSAVAGDFERRLTNETILVARGLAEVSWRMPDGTLPQDEIDVILAGFQLDADTRLQMYLVDTDRMSERERMGGRFSGGDSTLPLPSALLAYPELVTASTNAVSVDRREDDAGIERYYAAAPVSNGLAFIGYLQLSKPASDLQAAITQRWIMLGAGVGIITIVALLASAWLSTSLIRPLQKLRDSALRLSRGELSHRVSQVGRDEIGAVASAFNQMAGRLQAMIEEQRAFASNTSHELRTPLTTMRLRTEALRHDEALDESVRRQYIEELDDELARLSGLVEDLVLLSRFDAGRMEMGEEQIDLVRFARNLVQTMSRQAADHQITLALEVETEGPIPVHASLNHLMILFRNLLDNAIKYTPPGGHVTWRIAPKEDDILITVTDDGSGIAQESLPHIFERFYRADKSHSRSIPGTGLGLALARSIVETYHGRISVGSPGVGKGTTVTIRWPFDAEQP